jgi:chemotaxis protein MotB
VKRKKGKEPNNERWMLTYLDLITLLMVFFVILYASSNVDKVKYQNVAASFMTAFGGGKSLIGTDSRADIVDASKPTDPAVLETAKLEEVKKNMDKYLSQNNLQGSVSTKIEERGLVVSIQDSMFFDIGKADVRPEARKKIIEIGKILNAMGNYIRVEGHTDNMPISNYRFKSNWELSAIRATNVTEIMIDDAGIPPQMLASVGYGEYRPIADNSTPDGRSRNRRVDIIILNSKFNQVENNK